MEQRLIYANLLYDRLEARYKHSSGAAHKAYGLAIDDVCDAPTVEARPVVHGQWVDRIVDENEVIQPWMERYYYSECLEGGNQSWFKFCPNCGAKMDGGAN